MNRKSFILTSILLLGFLLLTTVSFAAGKDDWTFGVKAGLNFCSYSVSGLQAGTTVSGTTKFAFGGIVNKKIDDDMSIRTDVLILGKGVKIKNTDANFDNEIEVSNLAIAPFFIYNIGGDPKDMLFFLQGGLEMDVNMSNDWKNSTTISTDYESNEFLLNLGGGVKFPLTKGSIVTDLRYSIGLSNTVSTSGVTSKSRGVQLLVGYMFK